MEEYTKPAPWRFACYQKHESGEQSKISDFFEEGAFARDLQKCRPAFVLAEA